MERKEPPFEEQVELMRRDISRLAKKLKMTPEKTLRLLTHRELVIANRQLTSIDRRLALIYEKIEKKA